MKFLIIPILITTSTLGQRYGCEFTVADLPEEIYEKAAAGISLPEIHNLIQAAASKYRIPAEFIKSIVAAESNFNPLAVSPKGAVGLMQLMPETAREYGGDLRNPAQNIEAGTRYLSFLLQRYRKSRHPLTNAIAAYNAGPGAVDRYRGVPPYRETRGYIARVLGFLQKFRKSSDHDVEGSGGTDPEQSVLANGYERPSFR